MNDSFSLQQVLCIVFNVHRNLHECKVKNGTEDNVCRKKTCIFTTTKNNKTRSTIKETKNSQTQTEMSKKALDSQSSTNKFLRKQLRMHLLNNFTSNLKDENEYNSFVVLKIERKQMVQFCTH